MATYHTFIWQGNNAQGEKISGEINAQNMILAKIALKQRHIILNKIRKKPHYRVLKRANTSQQPTSAPLPDNWQP